MKKSGYFFLPFFVDKMVECFWNTNDVTEETTVATLTKIKDDYCNNEVCLAI